MAEPQGSGVSPHKCALPIAKRQPENQAAGPRGDTMGTLVRSVLQVGCGASSPLAFKVEITKRHHCEEQKYNLSPSAQASISPLPWRKMVSVLGFHN